MPSGVFKPYAGVSTGILIFTKTGHGGTDNVQFYDMKADGFSLDDKRSEVKENDIPDIIERFNNLDKEVDRDVYKRQIWTRNNDTSNWIRIYDYFYFGFDIRNKVIFFTQGEENND